MSTSITQDVLIVGSGPAGYTAAIYSSRAGLSTTVLAGFESPGGALTTTTEVENFPGFPGGVQGPELMDRMREQAESFGAKVLMEDAESMDLTTDKKTVHASDGNVYSADAVILATGAEYRKLEVGGEERLTGAGVSYCATCDAPFFEGQNVVVVGGGDSALEEATHLARFADTVTIVHRRDKFRASHAMVERLKNFPNIELKMNTVVREILGDNEVHSVLLEYSRGEQYLHHCQGVFIAVGHTPRSSIFKSQVDVDDEGYVLVKNGTTEVFMSGLRLPLPGVFACGDLVDSRYRQAITAAGSGCAAALDAQRYLEEIR